MSSGDAQRVHGVVPKFQTEFSKGNPTTSPRSDGGGRSNNADDSTSALCETVSCDKTLSALMHSTICVPAEETGNHTQRQSVHEIYGYMCQKGAWHYSGSLPQGTNKAYLEANVEGALYTELPKKYQIGNKLIYWKVV